MRFVWCNISVGNFPSFSLRKLHVTDTPIFSLMHIQCVMRLCSYKIGMAFVNCRRVRSVLTFVNCRGSAEFISAEYCKYMPLVGLTVNLKLCGAGIYVKVLEFLILVYLMQSDHLISLMIVTNSIQNYLGCDVDFFI